MEIVITQLTADVMQRMLVNEINNQKEWLKKDVATGNQYVAETRNQIIKELEMLRNQLEYKGIPKFRYV